MSQDQISKNRITLGFAIAPLIPIVIYAMVGGDLAVIFLAIGIPAAYAGALLIGWPLFLLLRHLRYTSWSYFILGGAAAALPFLYFYLNGAPTHVEIYGARNSIFFCSFGALGGFIFWLIAIRGQKQYSVSLIKQVIGTIMALIAISTGIYIAFAGITESMEGTMSIQSEEFISTSRREVIIKLEKDTIVSAYLPAQLPFRPGCPIYITTRKSYFSYKNIYWVNGYKDSSSVNIWEIINQKERDAISRQCK